MVVVGGGHRHTPRPPHVSETEGRSGAWERVSRPSRTVLRQEEVGRISAPSVVTLKARELAVRSGSGKSRGLFSASPQARHPLYSPVGHALHVKDIGAFRKAYNINNRSHIYELTTATWQRGLQWRYAIGDMATVHTRLSFIRITYLPISC